MYSKLFHLSKKKTMTRKSAWYPQYTQRSVTPETSAPYSRYSVRWCKGSPLILRNSIFIHLDQHHMTLLRRSIKTLGDSIVTEFYQKQICFRKTFKILGIFGLRVRGILEPECYMKYCDIVTTYNKSRVVQQRPSDFLFLYLQYISNILFNTFLLYLCSVRQQTTLNLPPTFSSQYQIKIER